MEPTGESSDDESMLMSETGRRKEEKGNGA
jgi:hypothetical protein